MFAEFFDFGLQRFQRSFGAAVEFVIKLAPNPGGSGVARRFALTVHSVATANRRCPGWRGAFQFAEQRAAEIEVCLAALQFEKLIVGLSVGDAILIVNGLLQMDENLSGARVARGEFVAA